LGRGKIKHAIMLRNGNRAQKVQTRNDEGGGPTGKGRGGAISSLVKWQRENSSRSNSLTTQREDGVTLSRTHNFKLVEIRQCLIDGGEIFQRLKIIGEMIK